MSTPDPMTAVSKMLAANATALVALLAPSKPAGLTPPAIFAYGYPRKVAGQPTSSPLGHDWAELLKAKAVALVVIQPSGRVGSGGDNSRALWSRARFDAVCYGRTDYEASQLRLELEQFVKDLSRVRVTLSTGVALVHDCTIEGGPISFPDPDTEAPVAVGIYAASIAEEHVA